MRTVDEVILAVRGGEFSEIEFWRRLEDKKMDYKTYKATPKRVSSLLVALNNTEIYVNTILFYRGEMTIHFEV